MADSDITVTWFNSQRYLIISSPRGHTTLSVEVTQAWQANNLARLLGAEYVEVP